MARKIEHDDEVMEDLDRELSEPLDECLLYELSQDFPEIAKYQKLYELRREHEQ